LKIREAELGKIPYMLRVVDKEMASSSVSLRLRNGENPGLEAVVQVKNRIMAAIQAKS
jgi:threonyl-tRNA synthetase